MLKNKCIIFGTILPYIWSLAFVILVVLSYANSKIGEIIAAEYLIPLTFILSPFIYFAGAAISLLSFKKYKLDKSQNMLVPLIFNVVMLIVWFIFRKPFYIELNLLT